MRIMFYSQHVLGIGHFFRSMEIAGALKPHRVLFVEGGDPLPGFKPPEHIARVILPSLMMDPDFKMMESRRGELDEVKALRAQTLMRVFEDFAPDVILTELFPFGRKQFRFELMPLLQTVRILRPRPRVVCSLRDILVEKNDQVSYEQGVLDILNRYYDLLLIHSDPRLTRLDETFDRVRDIALPVHYTGFVARPAPPRPHGSHEKLIVAATGGGKVGTDLLAATIEAVCTQPQPNLRLRVFCGPFMEEPDRKRLRLLASRDSRTSLEGFSSDFPGELSRADLAVTMAGYNTCMDILSAGVRALVFPFAQNREQTLRAQRLENLGAVRILKSLDPADLSMRIDEALHGPPPCRGGNRPSTSTERPGRQRSSRPFIPGSPDHCPTQPGTRPRCMLVRMSILKRIPPGVVLC